MACLPTIPDQIRQEQLVTACEALGFDPNQVKSLNITPREVTAEFFEYDEEGARSLTFIEGEWTFPTRTVHVDVTEDAIPDEW